MKAKWIKKSMYKYKKNHTYEFYAKEPTRKIPTYLVHVVYDYTAEEEVDFYDMFASQVSIKQCFKIDKIELDND